MTDTGDHGGEGTSRPRRGRTNGGRRGAGTSAGGATGLPGVVTAPDDDGVDSGRVYEVLASGPRRRLLAHLARTEEWVPVGDLAETLVEEWGTNRDATAAREDARIELRHIHLPKLRATGLVEVDDARSDADRDTPVRLTHGGRVAVDGHPGLWD